MKISGQMSMPLASPKQGQLGGGGKEPGYAENDGRISESKTNFLHDDSFKQSYDGSKKGSGAKDNSGLDNKVAYNHKLYYNG